MAVHNSRLDATWYTSEDALVRVALEGRPISAFSQGARNEWNVAVLIRTDKGRCWLPSWIPRKTNAMEMRSLCRSQLRTCCWIGHVERISDERMTIKIYDLGRIRLTFENIVLKILEEGRWKSTRTPRGEYMKRWMTVDEAKKLCWDRFAIRFLILLR